MASANVNRAIPTDEPVLIRPGVVHREADFHGSAKWLTLPPEAKERTDKGDLGFGGMAPPRPLSHGGKPFKLKEGK